INTDITPEYASKLGAAYGTLLKGNGKIGISCDRNPSTKMIKSAFISGLLTTGVEVYDLQVMLLPITRSAIRFYKLDGGIHISALKLDPFRLYIDVVDKNGCNIDREMERKIETIFIREDFLRCEGDCIKEVVSISDYSNFYLHTLINSVKDTDLKYRIVLNTSSDDAANMINYLLSEIGCEVELLNLKLVNSKTRKESMKNEDVRFFASHVKMGKYDLGVSVDSSSEKMMMLIDDKGRIVNEEMFLALVAVMIMKSGGGGTVVVPLSASYAIEKIAEKYNGKVVRSKTSAQDIMYKLMGSEQQDMKDQFSLHFDAMGGLVKILEFMAKNKCKLSDLVDEIPSIYMNKQEVECPWNAKGKVIREIIQEHGEDVIETTEGVKIFKNGGWVLILPDAELPICRIISESYSEEFAEELSTAYADRVRRISNS
ncbi:MAG: nucleotidyltransferase, partial [Clostridiaceae bacterium]|nr:nucleotidyltransferase [Clostridiaceae bacterium]